mgnify:FL=1
MIEPVNYGIQQLATQFILFKVIKMLFTVWPLMYLLVIKSALDLSITLLKFGVPSLASSFQHLLDIQERSLPYLSILTESLLEQDQWIAQQSYGMFKWVKFIQLLKAIKESLYHCILMQMET